MPPGPRVLVVRLRALGDVVLTTPLVRAIKTAHPASVTTLVTDAHYAPLLAGHPALARVVGCRPGESMRSLAEQLADGGYEVRIDLQASARSRRLRRLLGGSWEVAPRRRIARTLLIWLGLDLYGPYVPMAEQYFSPAKALHVAPDGRAASVYPSAPDAARAAELIDRPFVALAPGAAHASKRWPPAHWRTLAERLAARGILPVAVGTEPERVLLAGSPVVEAYGLSLSVTAALFQRARAVVANDSGLLHLAAAVGTPVVALLGPTTGQFGFLPYVTTSTVLERPLPCRPCSPVGSAHCPLGHHRCMIEIAPEAVAAAVEALARG